MEYKKKSSAERLAGIGFTICFIVFALLIGAALATITYNSLGATLYGKFLSLAICVLFAMILFALFKITAAERRRKNIWSGMEDQVRPEYSVSQTDYLIRRVGFSVREFTDSTRWLFHTIRLYKYATVGLSVISTIVLGLNFNYLEPADKLAYAITSKNIALVLNTIITAISTLAIFWNTEKYWIQNKVIRHQLKRLQSDIEFEISKSPNKLLHDEKLIAELFARHQSILQNFHLYWEGVLTEKNDKK